MQAKTLRKVYYLLKDTDWEFVLAFLFIYLKYRDFEMRIKAMRYVKYAFFERRFLHVLGKYGDSVNSPQINNGPIWVCWLQGEENMPQIVKVCYERLKKMAPPYREVVLLTFDNIGQYVRLPDYIYEKLRNGDMTYTHFSDILRFALLAEKGGLWVDSTVYVTKPISPDVFAKKYYSAKTKYDSTYMGVNRCLWKCFLLGASPQSQWFLNAREIMYTYWKEMNYFIDYLIVDYILLLIYDSSDEVKSEVDVGVEYAPYILDFEKIANEPCDETYLKKMCDECRWFKLSYKLPFREYTADGKLTYFGRLLSEKCADTNCSIVL
ncbi:MAG: capsular polysaccharide synthesis protein [Akkermansia sp.]|nr:capsular polysaccharide synthesis protein [Akkermansia sp.]